jgi:hypothetical protein
MRRPDRRNREWRVRAPIQTNSGQPGPDAPEAARQGEVPGQNPDVARIPEPRAFALQPDDIHAHLRMHRLLGKTWTNRSQNSECVLFDDRVSARIQTVFKFVVFLWFLCASIPPMWSGVTGGGDYHEDAAALYVNLVCGLPRVIVAAALCWLSNLIWRMIPAVMTESFTLVEMGEEPEVDLRPENLRITDRDRVHRPLVGRLRYTCVMHKVALFFDWRIPQINRNVEIPLELVAQALNGATLRLRGEEAELVFSNLVSRTPYVNYDRFALMDDCPPVLLASMLCRVVHGHNVALLRGEDF